MIVQDVVTGSLRLLGVYGAGDTPEPEDLADGLITLNEMLNDWNSQHLAVYVIVNRILPLTATTGIYTIGPGGTFDYPRPVKIESAGIIQSNGLRTDLKLDTSAEWGMIPEKTVAGRLPLRMYNNNDYPLAALRFWPVPSQNCQLDLYAWDELEDALILTDDFDLPPGYLRAVRYNLAVAIAPEYGRDPGPVVVGIAQESKASLFALNASTFAGTLDAPQPAQR